MPALYAFPPFPCCLLCLFDLPQKLNITLPFPAGCPHLHAYKIFPSYAMPSPCLRPSTIPCTILPCLAVVVRKHTCVGKQNNNLSQVKIQMFFLFSARVCVNRWLLPPHHLMHCAKLWSRLIIILLGIILSGFYCCLLVLFVGHEQNKGKLPHIVNTSPK